MIQPGLVLKNRYRVVRKMGKGGFGETFEVNDRGTPKVLKVLNLDNFTNLASKQKAITLFQREANVLKRLNHPSIPKVDPKGYFTLLNAANEPFHCLVMEKINGENLEEWLEQRGNQPITKKQAIDWLNQLVKVLEYLHHHRYFHRDIKPDNIILKPNGQLALIDFGSVREITGTYLAKLVDEIDVTKLVSSGYTPLEQINGKAVLQSDFFALGRTFVYLVTGQHPAKFVENDITGELIWRDSATQISPEFADLIDWMMAAFPGKRPANTQVILQSLDGIGKGLGGQVSPLPGSDPTSSFFYLRKLKGIGVKFRLAGLLLLGLVGFGLGSPNLASALNEYGLKNYYAEDLKSAHFYYKFALIFNQNFAKAHYNLGLVYEDKGDFKRAAKEYDLAIQSKLEKAYNNRGRLYILNQECEKAIPVLLEGLNLVESDSVRSLLLKNLGWARLCQNRYQEAQTHLRNAIALSPKSASPYCLLAQVLEKQENPKKALLEWENCLKYANDKQPDEKIWKQVARERLN